MIIYGSVTDSYGTPLIGVNIFPLKKGDSFGVGGITDYDGNFNIEDDNINDKQIVKLTYLGFAPVEISAGALKGKKIIMKESAEMLDEIIITAKKPTNIKNLKKNIKYVYLAGGLSILGLIIFNIKKYG